MLPKRQMEVTMNSFRRILDDIYRNCMYATEENEMVNRLMRPEYDDKYTEIKSFPHKDLTEIFFIGWEIRGGELNAFALSQDHTAAFRYRLAGIDRTQSHTHNYLEIAYVLEGEFCQNIQGKDVWFCKGECCLIDTNCTHQDYLKEKDTRVVFLGISNYVFHKVLRENIPEGILTEFFGTALLSQKEVKQYLHLRPKDETDGRIEEILGSLLKELMHLDVGSEYVCRGLIKRLLWHLCLAYDFSLSREQAKEMNVLIADEVLRYIREHATDITIRDLVRRFHYNEDYFNRLLKKREGVTYSAYLQLLRLEKARELLEESTLGIDEIIEICGYRNKGYFYKIFVEKYGMTPARLRESKQAGRAVKSAAFEKMSP
jgi:AraC-like DNA-binding protein/quercetin dioxygenase-like cupin family protein